MKSMRKKKKKEHIKNIEKDKQKHKEYLHKIPKLQNTILDILYYKSY